MSLFHQGDLASANNRLEIALANAQRVRASLYELTKERASQGYSPNNLGFLHGIAYAAFLMDLYCETENIGPFGQFRFGGDCDRLVERFVYGLSDPDSPVPAPPTSPALPHVQGAA